MIRSLAFAAIGTLFLSGSALAAEPLVSAEWLKANLEAPSVVVLDLREPAKEGEAEPYQTARIPGSVAAPYAKSGWRTTVNDIPGMLPAETEIEALLGSLGVEDDDHLVIVSDGLSSSDFGAAARVFWTLEVMGHDEISVLEGGFAGWQAAGFPVEAGEAPSITASSYDATFDPSLVATIDDVEAAVANDVDLVDARPVGQYTGAETPGNVGIAGTITGAASIPHNVLVKEGRDVVGEDVLATYRQQAGIADTGNQIAFCNTGHWAAVGWFALNKVGGNPDVKLYDGSMVEWAKVAGRPTEIGASRTVDQ